MHRFKDLEIWKLSRRFCSLIYVATECYPENEKFGLTNQLRRASVSIPSNIAEGASRKSNKDFLRFLEIAVGSCYELETQLLLSNDLGFLETKKLEELLFELNKIVQMTSKFMTTLKS
ncbi:four helix bundle protein [Flavobacterium sp. H122]|uniref:four helix bundle protein n=1 Tax=Flavobacterium sp. H122 TaxID=2529860 RepID=UPI0010A9BA37|nr:four helix bundle protein [Flavobacterium sp. H122]